MKKLIVGGSLVIAGAADAKPCDDVAEQTIAVVIGVDMADRLRLVGGVEGRRCVGDGAELMIRLEAGAGTPRIVVGGRVRPLEKETSDAEREMLGLEAGLTFDKHFQFGVQGAGTLGTHSLYGAAQVWTPIAGDPRPTRFTLLGGLAPWTMTNAYDPVPGRPVMRGGRIVRPRIVGARRLAGEERAVSEHFRAAAQVEYSSVWTFWRLARELAAVGAPPRLIVAALEAAGDELRHARMCAEAAGGIEMEALGEEMARARFGARTAEALGVLAAEAWVEGCLNEGAAATEARWAAEDAQGPVKGMLEAIARDEARHAALSWAVLAWVFEIAPQVADEAIRQVPRAVEGRIGTRDRALARYGVAAPDVVAGARAEAFSKATRHWNMRAFPC